MKDFMNNWQKCKVCKFTTPSNKKESLSWCKFEDEHPTLATFLMLFGQAVFVACAATVAIACFYL